MRILTFCQAFAVTVFVCGAVQGQETAEEHYRRGVEYGEAAQHASFFKRGGLAKKAQAEFERAVETDPNYLDARFALIEYDMLAPSFLGGSEEQAIAQANEIRKRSPVEGHRAFGRIFLLKKNYRDAEREFEASVALDGQFMDGWFEIGHLAALTGANLDRGQEALRKYLASGPRHNDPPLYRAQYWLGMIYEKQGKNAEAKAAYSTSLKANPNQKDVQEAMKRVS